MSVAVKRKQNNTSKQDGVNTLIHTITIHIPKNTTLANEFNRLTWASNNLYNTTLFYIRGAYTGNSKPEEERHSLEQQVINDIESILPEYKRGHTKYIQHTINKLENKKTKNKNDEQETQELKEKIRTINDQTTMFPDNKKTPNYNDLDLLFKTTNNENYRMLPAHVAQNVIREVAQNFDNYWDTIKDYNNGNTRGHTGRPSMPKYLKKGAKHTIQFPAVHVKIIEKGGETRLKLPKIKETLRIGKNMPKDEKLVTVRIVPVMLGYDVQLSYETVIPDFRDDGYKAGGDLGLNNLVAIDVNDGHTQPLVYNGRGIKSINQYFNKKIARAKSQLPSNVYTSEEIHRLCTKRFNQVHDIMNWVANDIALKLLAAGVCVFVLGLGKDFKNAGKKMRDNVKQSFYQVPFRYLADAIVVSCALLGIKVIIREESYTSQASLIDNDPIPTFVRKQKTQSKTADENSGVSQEDGAGQKSKVCKKKRKKKKRKKKKKKYVFSGSRVRRGLYKSRDGFLLNADVNGAGNILRKEFSDAFDGVTDFRYLMNPVMIQLPVMSMSDSWVHKVLVCV